MIDENSNSKVIKFVEWFATSLLYRKAYMASKWPIVSTPNNLRPNQEDDDDLFI